MKCDGDDVYTYENVRLSFEYFSKYSSLVIDLHKFGYGSIILAMLDQFQEELAGNMNSKSIERYKLYIYIGSLYNTAMVWLITGQKESIDEMAEMFYNTCAIHVK